MVDLIKVYNDFMLDYAELREYALNKTDKELAFELARSYQVTYPKVTNLHSFLLNSLNTFKGLS